MSGTYGNPTKQRMAYDADGTIVVVYNADADSIGTLSQTTLQKINSEGTSYSDRYSLKGFGYTNNPSLLTFVFPERRDIVGYFFAISPAAGTEGFSGVDAIYTSVDTTNGINGTWSMISTTAATSYYSVPDYRTPTTISALNIKAIRFKKRALDEGPAAGAYDTEIFACHLYGSKVNASDRVEFWKPTTNAILTPEDLDFGDIRRETTATKTFRVKNMSSTLTANNVTISASTTSTATGESTVVAEHQFSLDGGATYASTKTISSIAPGAISNVVTVKRTTSATSLLMTHSVRISAIAASWT